MKVGCITFHASYNYGSVLQAYSLQEFVKTEFPDIDYQIINFRSQVQKNMYSICPQTASLKYKFFLFFYHKQLEDKNRKFEYFINHILNITQEINLEKDLNHFDFDCYISGGDQIWNPRCTDFSWAYYLNFIHEKPKISYAVSMGPHCVLKDDEKKYIKEYIEDYKYISVREIGTLVTLNNVTGVKNNFPVLIDPVLLFSSTFWNKFIEDNKERFVVPSKPYILFYTLGCSDTIYKFVKKIEKKLKKRVIITKPMHRFDFFNYFENRFDTGPVDFLFLIKEADLIITTSFHACVFSAIFHKQFFAVDVENDNRIQDFLSKYNLNSVNIQSSKTDLSFCVENQMVAKFDYSCFDTKVNEERIIAKDFLKTSLAK